MFTISHIKQRSALLSSNTEKSKVCSELVLVAKEKTARNVLIHLFFL